MRYIVCNLLRQYKLAIALISSGKVNNLTIKKGGIFFRNGGIFKKVRLCGYAVV
jgi:hypothetical protein